MSGMYGPQPSGGGFAGNDETTGTDESEGGDPNAPIPEYKPDEGVEPKFVWDNELSTDLFDALKSGDRSAFVGILIEFQQDKIDFDLNVVDYATRFFLDLETAQNDLKTKLLNVSGDTTVSLSDMEKKIIEIGLDLWDQSGRPKTEGYYAAEKLLNGETLTREEAVAAASFMATVGPMIVPPRFRSDVITSLITTSDDAQKRLLDGSGTYGLMAMGS
jgi:hypothetical protein